MKCSGGEGSGDEAQDLGAEGFDVEDYLVLDQGDQH